MSAPAGKRLISGVEPHEPEKIHERDVDPGEQWRIYVGARWAWKYVLTDFEQAKKIYEVWLSVPELWVDLPETEIYSVPAEERQDSAEQEKAMFYRVESLMKRPTP